MKNVSTGCERFKIVRKKIWPSRCRRFFNASNTIINIYLCIVYVLHNSSRLAKFCFFFPAITTFYIILNYAFRTHVPFVYTWLREHLFEHACVKKLLFVWKCVRYVNSSVHFWIVGGSKGWNSAPCDDTAVAWFSNHYLSSFLSFTLILWIFLISVFTYWN